MLTTAKRRGRKPALAKHPAPQELAEQYQHYFETLSADTGVAQKAVWHLRYQVLCEERQLLSVADYPDAMETDVYDAHSMQAMLRYRPDQRLIGCIRLILPRAGVALPCFTACPAMAQEIAPEKTAELSRFIIGKEFRRRWNDGDYGAVSPWLDGDNHRRIPHCGLGLMQAVLQVARQAGVTHVVALMEPALLRLLEGMGIHFAPVGSLVNYYGQRQACYAKIDNLLRRLQTERPEIWHVLTEGGRLAP